MPEKSHFMWDHLFKNESEIAVEINMNCSLMIGLFSFFLSKSGVFVLYSILQSTEKCTVLRLVYTSVHGPVLVLICELGFYGLS